MVGLSDQTIEPPPPFEPRERFSNIPMFGGATVPPVPKIAVLLVMGCTGAAPPGATIAVRLAKAPNPSTPFSEMFTWL